jgi:hypothetical protein
MRQGELGVFLDGLERKVLGLVEVIFVVRVLLEIRLSQTGMAFG